MHRAATIAVGRRCAPRIWAGCSWARWRSALALASAFGERGTGQVITGSTPGDDARARLVEARLAMGSGDFVTANRLFFDVDQAEQERGVDNAEARTYVGWTLALVARSRARRGAVRAVDRRGGAGAGAGQ